MSFRVDVIERETGTLMFAAEGDEMEEMNVTVMTVVLKTMRLGTFWSLLFVTTDESGMMAVDSGELYALASEILS
jgi:hypothetical protein